MTALRTAQAAIADAGLTVADIDGFVAAQSLPSSGGHDMVDGGSYVSADWLSQHLGARPGYCRRASTGSGQLSGSMSIAINAVASGAAKHVLLHRALYNPPGQVQRQPDDRDRRQPGLGRRGGLLRLGRAAIAMVGNEYMQRYGATREMLARIVGGSAQERRAAAVVVLVRQAAHASRNTWPSR